MHILTRLATIDSRPRRGSRRSPCSYYRFCGDGHQGVHGVRSVIELSIWNSTVSHLRHQAPHYFLSARQV
jgi:hypothetical protein